VPSPLAYDPAQRALALPVSAAYKSRGMILRTLDWLARRGAWVIAGGLFVGLAFPDLARLCKPAIGPAVFVLLVATVLRIDWPKTLAYARSPTVAATVVIWLLVATPLLMWVATQIIPLPDGLVRALVLTACSPVLTAVPTFAMMLGLDAALALIGMVATSLLQPFLQPPLALLLLGIELNISVSQLMTRLGIFIAGGFTVALLIRLVAGHDRIARASGPIGGIAVLMLILFGVGAVDGLTDTVLQRPAYAGLFIVAAFVANFALQLIGGAAFLALARTGLVSRPQALTTALATGNRNLAILVAVLGGSADADLYLFLAVNQFPMYFVPVLLGPIYRRYLPDAVRPSSATADSSR
jgi:predicted Na+-dependent transporter